MRFLKWKIKKTRIKRFAKGSISIMLSFILSGVMSLAALLAESGRFQNAKQQLDEASLNSALSILANYDSDLEKRFGLYGIDSTKLSEEEYLKYLLFNSDATESGAYAGNNFSQLYHVTSGMSEMKYDLANYQVLQRQMLEYEKYRGPINIAEELLDVEKMLEELKKNIEKAIPGLEKMLEVCGAVADIADAIKKLYCLYKDVQQLQLTINSGGEKGLDEKINTTLGQGWELVEGMFSDEEWPLHDPSYIEAYEALKKAINEKVTYMKNTPKPEEPGPKPTVDVNSLKKEHEDTKAKYEEIELLSNLLIKAEELGYCDANGIVKATSIKDIFDDNISEESLNAYNLTKNSTRGEFFQSLNTKLKEHMGTEMSSVKESTLREQISLVKIKAQELKEASQKSEKAYNSANSQLNEWNQKNAALEDYNNKLNTYNENINNARDALLTVLNIVSEELGDYKSSLGSLTAALDKASKALETLEEQGTHVIEEKEGTDIFTWIKSQFVLAEEKKPEKGIQFLSTQRDKLQALKGEDITASYVFNENFSTGDLLSDSSYYMSKGQVTVFCTTLATTNILSKMAEFLDIIKAMADLVEYVNPLPSTYEFDCVVELNDNTTSILPSKINGGAGTSEGSDYEDIEDISAMLNEAKEMLSSSYYNDINAVDPNNRVSDAELTAELTMRINNLGTNMSKLFSNSSTMSFLGNATWPFVSTIFNLITLIPTLIEIINDLIFVIQHIEEAIDVIVSSLGEGILLNQYAITMFPNRTTDKNGNKHNEEISNYAGDARMYFPNNNKAVQTFSGAQVEYIIGGSSSEKENQQSTFWSIFAIRALNNIFGVLGDQTAMEVISAANIVAPLVFILWVYLESNIDMNLLVARKEVPLIKLGIYLSPEHLIDNLDQLCNAFDDIDEERAKEEELSYAAMKVDLIAEQFFDIDGMFDMEYQDYLWLFLFFTPNQTKVMRMADLIQIEMRYKKFTDGKEWNKYELRNMHTYVRCESHATFNSILPVFSLGEQGINNRGIRLKSIKYVGY